MVVVDGIHTVPITTRVASVLVAVCFFFIPFPSLAPRFPQDFFVVCFFLVWLVVALVPHYASHNEVLLDAWLSMWGVVIQPLLGVLMAGTIVSGTLSYVQSKEEITSM